MINVLVIDDSAAMRNIIGAIVDSQPDMRVIGGAPDPLTGFEMIESLAPDVITLDVEMPRMNGLTFLKKLMRIRPMPVVMFSSHAKEGSDVAFRALALGAIDFVSKPAITTCIEDAQVEAIARAIRNAHGAARSAAPAAAPRRVVVMAAELGGAQAMRDVLRGLPDDMPPVLVSLKMPGALTKHLTRRLAESTRAMVKEAENGEALLAGSVYFAPSDTYMRVRRRDDGAYAIALTPMSGADGVAADTLFASAADAAGADAIGVVMTGSGTDGAAGLATLRARGAFTIAQDEASCVAFGMPKAAIDKRAAAVIVPLTEIARVLAAKVAEQAR